MSAREVEIATTENKIFILVPAPSVLKLRIQFVHSKMTHDIVSDESQMTMSCSTYTVYIYTHSPLRNRLYLEEIT